MRTTLDLDERALAIARAKASHDQISLGKSVSALVLAATSGQPPAASTRNGFPLFPSSGHVVTMDLVNRHRDDA